jgi:thiol-disulfide isomerase/thioredoxin
MKKIFLFAASVFWLNGYSQNATITGSFEQQDGKRELSLSRPLHRTQFPELNDIQAIAVEKGVFAATLTVPQPEIMYLTSYVNNTIEFRQPIFLKSGYAITVNCKTENGNPQLTITGKGANDNQQWTLSDNISFDDYPKDTVPDRVITDLQNLSDKNLQAFNQYTAMHHPSPDFVKNWKVEMQYTLVRIYYTYARQRKIYVRQAYNRNRKKWDDAFNQMLTNAPLMNEAALTSSAYRLFLKMFLIFSKPQIWEHEVDKEEFVKKWYVGGRDTGSRSFFNDDNNIPTQKVIEKYFTGKVKEYMYAHLFKMALESGKVTNIDSIYADFSNACPFSPYKKIYDKPLAAVIESLKRPINDKMIFESGDIKTWAKVLNLFKGKTVLLDMWGTWCGPCREEIKNYGAAIKTYFKDKGLDFLYIANQDEKNVNTWKSLITYFNMEGHHILATKELTDDIEKNIQFKFYPTYVIIHRDGTFEVSKAGLGSLAEKSILIAQIEEALK